MAINIPNGNKIYQMAIKYTKWPQNIPNGNKIDEMSINFTKSFTARHFKVYPNRDFWFENIPVARKNT
jgi:hypothetical protein